MGPPEWVAGSGPVGLWRSNLASVTAMSQHLGDHFATRFPNESLERRGIFHPKDGLQGPSGTVHHGQRGPQWALPSLSANWQRALGKQGQTPNSYKPGKQILALQELHWSTEPATPHGDLNDLHLAKRKSQPGPNSSTPSMTFLCRILSAPCEPCPQLGPRRQFFSNKFICKIFPDFWWEFSTDALSSGNSHFTEWLN